MKAARYFIPIGWLLTATCRIVIGNQHGDLAAWLTYIVFLSFSIALVALAFIEGIHLFRRRRQALRSGGPLLDTQQVRRGIVAGWLASIFFRIATWGQPVTSAEWVSIALLGLFTVAVIVFFFWQEMQQWDPISARVNDPRIKYLLITLGLVTLILAPSLPEGIARSVSIWVAFFCAMGLLFVSVRRWRWRRRRSAHQ